MLAGLRAGQVQLLRRDEKGKVYVTRNEKDIIGWSADEILRGVMGLEAPTDLETSGRVQRLKELRAKPFLTPREKSELNALRTLVGEQLLGSPIEDEVADLKKLLGGPHSRVSRRDRAKSHIKTQSN